MLKTDLATGAPVNRDGSINLVHYAAWLVKENLAATDPRQLRPSELCRLLNSTPLGEVSNERQLHRHRTRAGMQWAMHDMSICSDTCLAGLDPTRAEARDRRRPLRNDEGPCPCKSTRITPRNRSRATASSCGTY